ncbi:MAG: hypothetical protein IK062_03255 [Selenomonadaceae bacterium]|nr:hypothetical protein [Selenomonadaceae bacterium]
MLKKNVHSGELSHTEKQLEKNTTNFMNNLVIQPEKFQICFSKKICPLSKLALSLDFCIFIPRSNNSTICTGYACSSKSKFFRCFEFDTIKIKNFFDNKKSPVTKNLYGIFFCKNFFNNYLTKWQGGGDNTV